MDPGSLKRITETVKSGAKAMAAMIDVYGDGSVADLFNKGQAISASSSRPPGNAQLMTQRLGSLRAIGMQTGIAVSTINDPDANGVSMAARPGLSGHVADDGVTCSTNRTAIACRSAPYGRGLRMGSLTPNMVEFEAGTIRDIAGMTDDSISVCSSSSA